MLWYSSPSNVEFGFETQPFTKYSTDNTFNVLPSKQLFISVRAHSVSILEQTVNFQVLPTNCTGSSAVVSGEQRYDS